MGSKRCGRDRFSLRIHLWAKIAGAVEICSNLPFDKDEIPTQRHVRIIGGAGLIK
jgi:hypothetical protein